VYRFRSLVWSAIGLSIQSPASGRLRLARVYKRLRGRGTPPGCLLASQWLSAWPCIRGIPALGRLVGRMLLEPILAKAWLRPANSAVRVWWSGPALAHLSTRTSRGARLCPRMIGWVGHILWLAKAKPPAGWGSYYISEPSWLCTSPSLTGRRSVQPTQCQPQSSSLRQSCAAI
jgi:hypothetical protein